MKTFKYQGSIICRYGSISKKITPIGLSGKARLNLIRKSNKGFPVKILLYKSLVEFILLYVCESWTFRDHQQRQNGESRNLKTNALGKFSIYGMENTKEMSILEIR